MLSTLLGSFTIYADASKDDAKSQQEVDKGTSEPKDGAENDGGEEEGGEAEEEEEPEDVSDSISSEDKSELVLFTLCIPALACFSWMLSDPILTFRRSLILSFGKNAIIPQSASGSRSISSIVKRKSSLGKGSRVRIVSRKCRFFIFNVHSFGGTVLTREFVNRCTF